MVDPRSILVAIVIALFSILFPLMYRMSRQHSPEETTPRPSRPAGKRPSRTSGKCERLRKSDIWWRLLNGTFTWSEGRAHYEALFGRANLWPLYRKAQDIRTELERLEYVLRQEDRTLRLAQQQLLNDLLTDIPIMEAQLEDLGGEGGGA